MSEIFIGLMSGTSIDGVDAVAARFDPLQTLAHVSVPMPRALREELNALQAPVADELERAARAANDLAVVYAEAVSATLAVLGLPSSAIAALGAHGQTVRHRPDQGYTIQLLNGALLAELTSIDTACDFRSADVAAGGQGAPLVPAFHGVVFTRPGTRNAIVNIGGIANVTLLAEHAAVRGHDTGPGNCLLDAWVARHRGTPFDDDGRWAAGGKVDAPLLARMRAEPYFAQPAPKSTGRDLFNAGWLDAVLAAHEASVAPQDVQATLVALTASSIAADCKRFGAQALWVCGGGARNGALMSTLRSEVAPAPVDTTATLGLDPQAVEATAFAWLAMRRSRALPGSLTEVTGARIPKVLGALHRAR